ncbi:MAG: ABC transporter substrate-binding protein [Acidimicrobiales bacterium]
MTDDSQPDREGPPPPPSGPARRLTARRALVAALAATGLVAAVTVAVRAGDDGGTSGQPAADTASGGAAPAAPQAVSPGSATDTSGGGDAPAGAASTMEELEARWAEDRQAMVAALSAPGLGVGADNVLRGPGGFQLDLNACPAGWSPTEGIDDTRILLGHTTARTGNLSSSGRVTDGLQAYLDEVNAGGGVAGRRIELVVKDDGFVPTATAEEVGELLAADKPFAVTTLGSPTSLAVYDTLNEACVPQPFVISSHPAWGDPVNHPWTVGLQLSPPTEAVLWGTWIEQNLAGELPVTVGALVMDNELGRLYELAFQRWAEAHPNVVSSFVPVHHPAATASVSAEMDEVAAPGPRVFLAMTAGRPCLQAVEQADGTGLRAGAAALFLPSSCQDAATFLAPAGPAADGWRILGGGLKATADPAWADDPFVAFARRTLSQAGLDPADPQASAGFGLFGWAEVEALRVAAELPGGLTRPNLILALRGLQLHHPLSLDGIVLATSGNADPYPLEGSEVLVFDAAAQAWRADGGPVLDVDGSTPPCPWTGGSC